MWSWEGFFSYLSNEYIFQGAVTTIWLTIAAILLGLLLGLIIALLRMSNVRAFSTFAAVYIWLFRGTPLLVQLIVLYTGLPQMGIRLTVIQAALIGLTLNEAAYLSEIIRAGISAVPVGQQNAARALGFRNYQVMLYVVLPQAFRIIIPPLGNSINSLLKMTSVTSVISMEELLRRTQILIQEKFMVLELFAVAAIYYLALTTLWDFAQRRIEARVSRGHKTNVSLAEQG
ncbi:amino acid ABC transporter permease [Pseudaminobacter arsenicus]|uniref:Glutamate/aspartate import permease protein GltK n=1 Tax=Borborobacter arsenicus TaxID=1851146 RepID=A0A432UZY8_9HYPH|nr:amino acid ABC transporter permease [Pseudaminobacter arsenicus]RUM95395.1 amino acid ABC transporter permease [Pseudaminobacter arsenicus]